jgi:hypothetical protein
MYALDKIEENLQSEYAFDKKVYINEDFSLHEIMQNHFDIVIDDMVDSKVLLSIAFEDLSEFYLMYALYVKIFDKEKSKAEELFANTASYSHGLITFFNKQCHQSHSSVVMMRKAIYLWSSLFLVKWDDEAIEVGSELIDSLNKQGNIIRYGNRFYPESWFLIDLFSLAFNKPYDKTLVDYPDNMKGYDIILKQWDTKEQSLVNDLVSTLCDIHLGIRETDEDEPDFEYLNFNKEIMKYYPYIVIVFLAIRELKGLKNPKTFTHPLMNTPIAKMFLEMKEPLPKPTELPYAKELLEKLKEKCPDVEVPKWLDGNTEKVNEAKSNDIIPDDFLK